MKRPQKYITGSEYWSNPKSSQNAKDDYLDLAVRHHYYDSIIEKLKKLFSPSDSFTLHEFGCGWGTNLAAIKQHFPNVQCSANDVWKDAIEYVRLHRPYIKIVEMDTFEFINSKVDEGYLFDIVITNAHLIHFKDESLKGLAKLHSMCQQAILQENIIDLNDVVSEMKYEVTKISNAPDSDYQYYFHKGDV